MREFVIFMCHDIKAYVQDDVQESCHLAGE